MGHTFEQYYAQLGEANAAGYETVSEHKAATAATSASTAKDAAKKVAAQGTNKGRGHTSYARNEALAAHQNLAAQNTLSYQDLAGAAYWNSTKGRGHASTARNTYLTGSPASRARETGLGKYGSIMEWYNNIKSERDKAANALSLLKDEKKNRDTLNRAKATWAAENWSRDDVEEDDLDEQISAAERALQMAEEEYGYAKEFNDLELDSAWEQNLLDQGISWGNAYTSTYQAQAGLQQQIDELYKQIQGAQRENKNASMFGAGQREEASGHRLAELEAAYDRLNEQMEMVSRRNQYALEMMTKDSKAAERGKLRGDFLLAQDESTQQQAKADFVENYTKGNTMGGVWNALRADRSDYMPTNDWSQEQLLEYQTLLGYGYEDRAREYAAKTNKSINDTKMEQATAPKYEWGYGAEASGVGRALRTVAGTAATVATAPERLASYLNKVQDVYTTGVYTGEDRAQLHDYAEAIASGRAQAMNDRHGTIDGKGWGDVYQAINSMAQSMVYGNALGSAGTLAIFFGQAADSGFDEAIERGASGEQAAKYGLLSGAAEVIAEKMPLDNLLATDKAAARGVVKSILKQSGLEGAEEGITSLMNTFADKLVMGDKSALDQQINQLMAEGASYDDARSKTMKDYANSVAWDVVIGAVSGAAGAGLQYGRDAVSAYDNRYGADARTLVDEAKQIKDKSGTLRKAEARLSKGKAISNATAKKLVTTVNRSRVVDAVEKQINTRSTELPEKTARSLANAIVAKSRSERLTDNQRKLIEKNTELVSEIEKDMSDSKPADWVKAIGVRGAEAAVYGDRNVINARQQAEQTMLNSGEYSEAKAANIEDGQDVQEYSEDFDVVAEVFGNSNNFQNFDEVWNTIKADTILTEAQARTAWETGKARLAKTDMTPKLTRRGTGKLSFEAVSDGGVQYEAPSAEETETFKRSARYQYLEALAKKIGVDIVFFKGGAEGINGKYQNGTVYLAIDASPTKYDTVDGYVMLTAAHELTHYIREASPARYAELKDFVTKHLIEQGKLENGKTLTALIAAKRRAYADADIELSVDAAVEEVIADACELMLKDNTLVLKLESENRSLYGLISRWLNDLWAKVKEAFTGLDAYHAEAKGMMDSFDELQRIWNLGLTDAAQAEVMEAEGESVPGFALKDDAEILHLKEQIVRAQEQLDQMQPVANITFDKEIPKQVSEKRSMLEGLLKSNKVIDSLVVGKVEFDTKRIGKGLTYARTDADIAGFLAVPTVIKRGIVIEYHPQHKGGKASTSQDVESWTIAAPVVLNGKRGNMGVIVQKTTGMFYKAHKVLMPDGSAFLLDEVNKKEKANPGPVHGATTSGRLDEPTRFASDTRISETNEKGKGKLSLKDDAVAAWTQARDIMQQRNDLQRRLEEFKTTDEYNTETDKFFKAVISGENQETAFAEYREWEERSGYAQMTADIKRLDEEYNRLFDEYTRLNNEAEQEEKNAAIAKSGLDEDAYYQKQAVKEFGYTPYFYDAGYIVPNGRMLNFSGEKGKHYGMRGQDHRAIGTIYPSNISGSEAMLKFMGSGNVRIMAETPGVDIAVGVEPTKEQYSTIGKFVNDSIGNRYFSVDFTDSKGITVANLEYEGNFSATKVKADIKHYFETGEIRKQSTVQRFMYSLKDDAYMSAVDSGDMETAQRMVDEAAKAAGYTIGAYHGTPIKGITVFDPTKIGTTTDDGLFGHGFYFATNKLTADGYATPTGQTMPVFLNIKKAWWGHGYKVEDVAKELDMDERSLTTIKVNNASVVAPAGGQSRQFAAHLKEKGYDSVIVQHGKRDYEIVIFDNNKIKSADPVTYDDAGNVIPLSQRFNERQPDIRYSIKDEAQSDRMLLANTLMTAAQNDGERRRLNNYKAQIDVFADIQQQLADAEDELSRAYRTGDKAQIAKAQKQRDILTDKLIRADKKLLELQATKPLKELLKRVKQDTRRSTQRQQKERRGKKELRDKIKRLHSQMSTQLLKPKENKYVPKELLKTVAEFLDLVNLDSGRSEKIKAKMTELSGQYQAIAQSNEYGYVFDANVADMISKLQSRIAAKDDTSIYNMSKAELEMVYNTMKAINHTVRESVKLIGVEENRNIFELAKAMMKETGKANPVASKLANKYINATLRPDVFFKRMGGYVKNSVWQFMGDMLNEAQRKQTQLQMEGAAIFEELMRDTKAFDEMTDPKNLIDIGLEDESGKPVLVTMDIALKIYMDTMAEDNARHFMSGGYTVPNMREYYKGKVSDAFSRGSVTIHGFGPLLSDLEHQLRSAETEEEQAEIKQKIEQAEADAATWVETLRQNIFEQMGEYEMRWVEAAEKFFNQFSQRVLNETTMAVYGFEKATVPYYVPIHTDAAYRQANFESISRDMSLENSGFMKQRVKASNPMLAEGIVDVINGQIDKVAKYAAMMPAIRNFQKVYGKSTSGFENSVQAAVRSKYGNEALKYIENIITDLTSPRRTEGGLLGEFADRLRGNLAQAALTVNPRVALEQATSYPKAAVIVGYGPLLKAMRDIKNNPVIDQTAREEIAQWTPLMWYRMKGYFDRDIGDLRNDKQMLDKVNNKLKFITGWIEAVEGSTVGQMWYAAQYYVEDTTDLERGTDEFMQETAKVFNRIVEQTQANYTMFQRPDILRNPNAIVKQLTMFMTERLQNANMVFDAVGTYNAYARDYRNGENDVTEEDVRQAKQTVVRTTSSLMAATAASVAFKLATDALMYSMKGYRDDDEELTAESIIGQAIENFFESIAGNFLWGSELFSIMRSVITGETYYGISLGGVETFTDALNALVKTMQEPTEENWKKSIKTAMQMLGIPVNNGIKIYNAIAYRIKDAQEGNGWGDFASEVKMTEERRAKQMYKAIINEDVDKLQKLVQQYKTEAAADAALAKHIKTMYQNDELSEKEARTQLMDYASMSEYDAKLAIDKLRFEKEHGFAYDDMKQQYLEGAITDKDVVRFKVDYGDVDEDDAAKEVNQWRMEKVTGLAYSKISSYLASGDINETTAAKYLMDYGGYDSLEAAEKKVSEWMGEIETGIPYDKVEDYYAEKLISRDELINYYMNYKWLFTEDYANEVADKRDFIGTDDRLSDISVAAVQIYNEYFAEEEVDKVTYRDTWKYCNVVRADKDENGKSISYSAMDKKLEYIDSLNLSAWQKTLLAKSMDISEKNIKKRAPWA